MGAPQVSEPRAFLAFYGCALFTVPRDNDRPAPICEHPLLVPVGRGRPEGTANMTGKQDRWAELTGGQAGEEYAQRFARLVASGHDVHGEAAFCDALLRPDARVLDAGCGTGRIAIRLAELGHRCTGVDVDSSMLAVARRDAPRRSGSSATWPGWMLSAWNRTSTWRSLPETSFPCSPPAVNQPSSVNWPPR